MSIIDNCPVKWKQAHSHKAEQCESEGPQVLINSISGHAGTKHKKAIGESLETISNASTLSNALHKHRQTTLFKHG